MIVTAMTLFSLIQSAGQRVSTPLVVVAVLSVPILFAVAGSFALEAWTGWPDIMTIGIMMALMVLLPSVGAIIGIIGLFYFPW